MTAIMNDRAGPRGGSRPGFHLLLRASGGQERRTLLKTAAFGDVLARVAFPFPGRDRVAEDGFQQRAEGELAVVAVGQEDHAGVAALKADHVVLRAVAVPFLEECRPEAGAGQESPADAVTETDRSRRFGALRLVR